MWSLICTGQQLHGIESAWACDWSSQCCSSEENWFSLSRKPSVANRFLARRGWDFVPTSPILCYDLIWLEPAQVLDMTSQSWWAHMCFGPAVSWKQSPWCYLQALALPIPMPSLPHRPLGPEGKGLIKASFLALSAPSLSLSAHCLFVGLFVNYCLPWSMSIAVCL